MIAQPTLRNRMYLFARTIRTRGLQKTLHYFRSRIALALRNRRDTLHTLQEVIASSINRRMPADLPIRSAHVKWGLHYVPSPFDVFRKAVGSLPIRFGEYTFVGKRQRKHSVDER
jgi:hypothetical protein